MEGTAVLSPPRTWVRSGNVAPELRDTQSYSRLQRQLIWQKSKGICGNCNKAADPGNWHADHILARAKGGLTTVENGQVSHPSCNLAKSDSLQITTAHGMSFLVKVLLILGASLLAAVLLYCAYRVGRRLWRQNKAKKATS